jgi:hypothetical protein
MKIYAFVVLILMGCQTFKKEEVEWRLRVYALKIDGEEFFIDQKNLEASYNDYRFKEALKGSTDPMTNEAYMECAAIISQGYLNLYPDGRCEFNIIKDTEWENHRATYRLSNNFLLIEDGSKYKILSAGEELKLLSRSKKMTLTFERKHS